MKLLKRLICDETPKEEKKKETMEVKRETKRIVDINATSKDLIITTQIVNGKLNQSICIQKDEKHDWATLYSKNLYVDGLDALKDLIEKLTKVANVIEYELGE